MAPTGAQAGDKDTPRDAGSCDSGCVQCWLPMHRLCPLTSPGLGHFRRCSRSRAVLANTSATQTLLVPTAPADFLATHSDIDIELQERPSHEIGIIADTVDSARLARGGTRRLHATADTKLSNTTEPNMRPYRLVGCIMV
jgi:hypothetical protein